VSELTAICGACHGYITDNTARDNRYRGCDLCGWVMHHGCWIEALSLGDLHSGKWCPITIEVTEAVELVPTGGTTASGRPKRKRQTVVRDHADIDPGHMDVIGMRGEWGPLE
jgi:hypothetical protein